jgi:GNAT superfamily N-acetyltransferase
MNSTRTAVNGPTSEEARRNLVSISPFFIVKNLQASIAFDGRHTKSHRCKPTMSDGVTIRILGPSDDAVLQSVAPEVFDNALNPALAAEFLRDPRLLRSMKAWWWGSPRAPTHRGRGLGKAIIQVLREHARRLGCRKAWVLTDRTNHVAMRLFASAGGEEAAGDHVMFNFALDRSTVEARKP